jgi:hypothetical protein
LPGASCVIGRRFADNDPGVNLAYVITAHKNPQQMLRLLGAIYRPGNTHVLHVDSRAPHEMHAAARQFAQTHPNCSVIRSESVIWGSWRLAHAQMRGMTEALRVAGDWSYCINLTAADYPLKTHEQIVAAIGAGPRDANYLEVLEFNRASDPARKRLEYYWIPWKGRMQKLFRRRPPKFSVYWGSNYFALTRAACEHLATSDLSRQMQRYFRFALCADEMIFQNALMHGPAPLRESIVSKTFRTLPWNGGSHPKIYTLADLDTLLASDAWYARKFDPAVDARVLDALDEHLARHARAAVA